MCQAAQATRRNVHIYKPPHPATHRPRTSFIAARRQRPMAAATGRHHWRSGPAPEVWCCCTRSCGRPRPPAAPEPTAGPTGFPAGGRAAELRVKDARARWGGGEDDARNYNSERKRAVTEREGAQPPPPPHTHTPHTHSHTQSNKRAPCAPWPAHARPRSPAAEAAAQQRSGSLVGSAQHNKRAPQAPEHRDNRDTRNAHRKQQQQKRQQQQRQQ